MIEHTTDLRRVKRLADVYYPKSEGPWKLIPSRKVFYLIEVVKGEDLGFWIFHPHPEQDALQLHAAMGPKCSGRAAIRSVQEAFEWIFDNTDYKTIVGETPQVFKPAWMMAAKAGMKHLFTDDFGLRHYEIGKA